MTAASHSPGSASVGVVIAAAGASTRMEGEDKILAPLSGGPLILHTVAAFERCPSVSEIVVVVAERSLWETVRLLDEQHHWSKVRAVKAGGPRRQDSVALGLAALPPCEWVVVHDGARPLVDAALVERGVEAAAVSGAAVAAVPAKDTMKVVGPTGEVQATPERSTLWAVQTPQVFRRDLLERAHREVSEDVTDDAAMVERLGLPVQVFMGAYTNLKVTTPDDLLVAETLLANGIAKSALLAELEEL